MTEKKKEFDSSLMTLKTIEFQMNKHLKDKNGQKFQKVTIDYAAKNNYNADVFDNLVEKEICGTFMNKKWDKLPIYFKWKCIQEYLQKNNIIDTDCVKSFKDKLSSNTLVGIEYNQEKQEITKIAI